MKFKLILTGIAFMLYTLTPVLATDIFSTSETYDEALAKAKDANTLLITYVSAEWNTKCKLMENTTFKKAEFQTLLAEKFYPLKVTITDTKGRLWKEKFNITSVPTLLFFDEEGELIKRTEHLLNYNELKSEMLAVLEYNKTGEWPIERDDELQELEPSIEITSLAPSPISDTETLSTPSINHPTAPSYYRLDIASFSIEETHASIEEILDKVKLLSATQQITIKQEGSQYIIYIKKIEGYRRAVQLESEFKARGFPDAYLSSF